MGANHFKPLEKYLTVSQAAARLGRGRWTVSRWVRIGLLPGIKISERSTLIPLAALENFQKPTRGPKPKRRKSKGAVSLRVNGKILV